MLVYFIIVMYKWRNSIISINIILLNTQEEKKQETQEEEEKKEKKRLCACRLI